MERQFLGVWIPKEIYLHKELTPTEKLLMAEIMSFSKNGVCFASNEHFAEFLGVSRRHVSRMIGNFVKLKLVKIDFTYKEGTKEVDKRFISPTLSQEDTPLPTLTQTHAPVVIQDNTPIDIDVHTPIDIHVHTPRHTCPDPIDIDVHTPTTQMSIPYGHTCPDPIDIDVLDKEKIKEQDKIQIKEKEDIRSKVKKRKNNIPLSTLEAEFARLWELYPRKEKRAGAEKKYITLRKENKVTYEEVENGLYRYLKYIEQEGTEREFIPHGATWFNQHRWQDEYTSVQPKKKASSFLDYYKDEFGGSENYGFSGYGEVIEYGSAFVSQSGQNDGKRRI